MVGDSLTPGFKVGHNLSSHIGAGNLKSGRQLILGQPTPETNLGQMVTDVVGLGLHTGHLFGRPKSSGKSEARGGKTAKGGKTKLARFKLCLNRIPSRNGTPNAIAPASSKPGCS